MHALGLLVARHRAGTRVYAGAVDTNAAHGASHPRAGVLHTSPGHTKFIRLASHVVASVGFRNARKVAGLARRAKAIAGIELGAFAVVGITKFTFFALYVVAGFLKAASHAGAIDAGFHRGARDGGTLVLDLYASGLASLIGRTRELAVGRALIRLALAG